MFLRNSKYHFNDVLQFQDFKPFESNFATLLVRPRKSHPSPNIGHLIIKKAFGHITECHAEAVTTIDLDLRDPDSIGKHCFLKVDRFKKSNFLD